MFNLAYTYRKVDIAVEYKIKDKLYYSEADIRLRKYEFNLIQNIQSEKL